MTIRRRIALACAIFIVAALAVPATAQGATVERCKGLAATIVGTPGDDVLRGTDGRDVIVGLGGDDRIIGGRGNDVICGGRGRDRINGGAGKDDVQGGSGNDRISGGFGNDVVDGGAGNDRVFGNGGDDIVRGSAGRDRISGDAGSDTCVMDTRDGVVSQCESLNSKTLSGQGDAVVDPALTNAFVVARHCFPFIGRCEPYYVARVRLDGATSFDVLGIQAFNADGQFIASYGDAADSYEGVFIFGERPAAIEIDSGGGSWELTFVQKSGVVVGASTESGTGNAVYLVDTPVTGLVTASVTWSGYGNFAVRGVSPAEGSDLLVNEVRFPDQGAPPFTVEKVAKSGIALVQVITDAGGWTISLQS